MFKDNDFKILFLNPVTSGTIDSIDGQEFFLLYKNASLFSGWKIKGMASKEI